MIRKLQTKILLMGCMLLAMLQMVAQGWEYKYSPDGRMAVNTVYPTRDNAYLVTGWNFGDSMTSPGHYAISIAFQRVMKIDANGNAIWKSDLDSIFNPTMSNITQDRGLIIMGEGYSGGSLSSLNLMKVDSNGQKQWLIALHPAYRASGVFNLDIDTTDDGGFICTYTAIDTAVSQHAGLYVSRLNAAGSIVWEKTYFSADTDPVAYSVRNSKDGGFIFSAAPAGPAGSFVYKTDSIGNLLWQYAGPANCFKQTTISADNNILILSTPFSPGPAVLSKLDQSGNVLWSQTYAALPDSNGWFSPPVERDDHTFALLGGVYGAPQGYSNTKFSLSFIDTLGNLLYYKSIPSSNLGNVILLQMGYKCTARANDNGYLIGGMVENDPDGYLGFVIKTDSNGVVYPSILSGSVFWDANDNCIKDSGETYITPVYITLTNAGDTFAIVTGDSGFYSSGLDTGSYTLQVAPPSPYWQPSSCNPTGGYLSAGADSGILLGLTPVILGPYIDINGHLSRQVLCQPAIYTVEYCNTGTTPFAGYIQIDMDTMLQVDSASVAWTSLVGNQYTFIADTLGVMQCSTFEIYCTVHCDSSLLGRTACIDAQAYEDTILNPPALWDRSNLRMAVAYDQATDTITFTLTNKGTGGMSGPEGMIVIEDNVILMTTPVQLAPGAQAIQQIKANGATWRATADQTPFNPYSKFTTAAIEAAGTNTLGGVSLGYIMQYPYNGYTSYQYNTCAQIYDSYDPNEKSVSPTGAGPQQLIDTNVVLEYTIDFQNTGTATAYTVTVTDTLAPYLNPATARLEISSSPCQMQIVGRNTMIFTFYNINLPDSSASPALSTGFVKFRVSQNAGNTNGTVINNKAGIYFDYNPPVITNTATVRIGQVLITGIQNVYAGKPVQISAYPNPFVTSTTIQVKGETFSELALDIYDVNGQQVRHQEVKNSDCFILDRTGLSSGDYVFEISTNGQAVGSGKIVAQ